MSKTLFKNLELIRKDLHKNFAELSTQEFRTCQKIFDYLIENTDAKISKVGGTGIIATFEGKKKGKTIMLRADIDALPITETNDFEHKSTDPKVSHKCGHDGHTTILLAVAELLTEKPINKGKIVLLWQPAEENGTGAKAVMADKVFKKLNINQVFALHNLPGIPLNKIVYKSGAFTANVRSLIIELNGRTAHAAEPEHGENPALAISEILQFCEKLTEKDVKKDKFFLITPIYSEFGTKDYGISAGSGELHLTIRSWDPKWFDKRVEILQNYLDLIAEKYSLKIKTSWTQEFFSNQNDKNAVKIIKKSAENLNLNHQKLENPFKWGEDFGLFTQKISGAMFGIGSGVDCPALHNPDYDFPDEITETAATLFYKILENAI
ncbi:M20 metallopeptidase family protein [Frigoriflavimonas asaccharolytica]|uniref:Amidohydrolase n=1 Tax=Frigoriflavimonas asaccharolytica TaxID=2735899 RepID=A0A8J8G5R7_9FLAO|nr:amidohydrolase [Frigoriflavimonas asaccharolytica]NRS91551.1 amidohydrolase [Frigoriflavimonas asaccharolytica]